jgi:hypothetical protein
MPSWFAWFVRDDTSALQCVECVGQLPSMSQHILASELDSFRVNLGSGGVGKSALTIKLVTGNFLEGE